MWTTIQSGFLSHRARRCSMALANSFASQYAWARLNRDRSLSGNLFHNSNALAIRSLLIGGLLARLARRGKQILSGRRASRGEGPPVVCHDCAPVRPAQRHHERGAASALETTVGGAGVGEQGGDKREAGARFVLRDGGHRDGVRARRG